ncbi:MAG: lipoate--protein ligase family protein [Armatimonadota bacterium]
MVAARWRLILDGPAQGFWNMAVDEALFHWAEQHGGCPVIRFYAWHPPCVSLGKFQKVDASVDLEACRRLGIELVRRPTGGRAILHESEVTYSIVAPLASWGILESYRYLSEGLVLGLRKLGIEACYGAERAPNLHSRASCFAHAARCDIVVGGRKVIGSAQVRGRRWLLQQGSIPLEISIERNAAVFGWRDESDAGAASSLSEVLDRPVAAEEVICAMVQGFESALQAPLKAEALTPREEALAEHLARTKYAVEEWTLYAKG